MVPENIEIEPGAIVGANLGNIVCNAGQGNHGPRLELWILRETLNQPLLIGSTFHVPGIIPNLKYSKNYQCSQNTCNCHVQILSFSSTNFLPLLNRAVPCLVSALIKDNRNSSLRVCRTVFSSLTSCLLLHIPYLQLRVEDDTPISASCLQRFRPTATYLEKSAIKRAASRALSGIPTRRSMAVYFRTLSVSAGEEDLSIAYLERWVIGIGSGIFHELVETLNRHSGSL